MQGNKLYVGNLKYSVSNDQLRELFSSYGEVANVNVIEGKGFGFVEMSNDAEAQAAIRALNQKPLDGRDLTINVAKARSERPSRF